MTEMYSDNITEEEKEVLRDWIKTNKPSKQQNVTIDGIDYVIMAVFEDGNLAGYKVIKP